MKTGQLFIVGFPGEKPSNQFLDFLRTEQIGGVILFADNCLTHETVRSNVARIKAQYSSTAPFIAIDQEGGRVCRIKGAPVEFGAAEDFGASGSVERFSEIYARALGFLSSLGINLNLAPVCDLHSPSGSDCLDGRCFGQTPDEVIPFVVEAVKVARREGVMSCLKHFPGLGAAEFDPHKVTAEVDVDLDQWNNRERAPFAAGIDAGAEMVMTTHVRLTSIDSKIATLSEEIVNGLLRRHMGFDGLIVTDDLLMSGADENKTREEVTIAAFNAGHDLLLFGQNTEQSMKSYFEFKKAVASGKVQQARLAESLARIAGAKSQMRSSVLG